MTIPQAPVRAESGRPFEVSKEPEVGQQSEPVQQSDLAQGLAADSVFHAVWSRFSDVKTKPEPVVLAFEASWCGPCQQMAPILTKLQNEGYRVRRVDVDKDRATTRKYNIQSLPAILSIVGGKEQQRIVGVTTEAQIRRLVHRSSASGCKGAQPARSHAIEPPVPAASKTVPLIRATYPIGKEKAVALLEFLKSHSDVELELKLRDSAVEITTTPEKQMGIGRFIEMFLTAELDEATCVNMPQFGCQIPIAFQQELETTGE
jgi:thiol-disulfide isomerase/thioredoxin